MYQFNHKTKTYSKPDLININTKCRTMRNNKSRFRNS